MCISAYPLCISAYPSYTATHTDTLIFFGNRIRIRYIPYFFETLPCAVNSIVSVSMAANVVTFHSFHNASHSKATFQIASSKERSSSSSESSLLSVCSILNNPRPRLSEDSVVRSSPQFARNAAICSSALVRGVKMAYPGYAKIFKTFLI